jgi:ethanolamine utilization cobalamin adenosyltransferase
MGKKEHKTSLSGGEMVDKTHPTVEFRGRIDSLCALVVELQILGERQGLSSLVEELGEVLDKLYDILSCEVSGKACDELFLWGMGGDEIRERSHHPERYFGIGHIRPHYTMGVVASGLNALRTQTRETELSACRAFSDPSSTDDANRADIIKALNRLSSAVYILTYKYLPDGYDKTVRFTKRD